METPAQRFFVPVSIILFFVLAGMTVAVEEFNISIPLHYILATIIALVMSWVGAVISYQLTWSDQEL